MRRLIESRAAQADPRAADPAPQRRLRDPQKNGIAFQADFGTLEIEIVEVSIKGDISNCPEVFSGENTTIRVLLRAHVDESNLTVGLRISDSSGALIYGTNTYHHGLRLDVPCETRFFLTFAFRMCLGPGEYRVGVSVHTGAAHTDRCFHWKDNAARFAVVGNIEEHFEGVANLPVSISGGTLEADTTLNISRREIENSHCRSLLIHSPRVSKPAAIIAVPIRTFEAQPEEVFSVEVTVTNAGREVWPPAGTRPVCCAYHVFDNDGNCITYDGIRTRLREAVRPDETVALHVAIVAPVETGTYQVEIDVVQESVSWFGASGKTRFTLIVGQSGDASGR